MAKLDVGGGHPVARIEFNGIFDMEDLYKYIGNWFKTRRYFFQEEAYKHKIPTIFGEENEIKVNGWRKITKYYKYNIKVFIHSYDVRKIEIKEKGKKKTLSKGRILIEFSGDVETDYQGVFKSTPLLKKAGEFLDRFIFDKPMDVVWSDRLYYIILKFHARVKEHLNMTTKGNAYEDVW
jgi:hypothetical protein